jgi:predicted ArsR family transcriptional regulator
MTRRQDEIVALISRRGSISCSELAQAIGCSPRTAGQHLWTLGKLQRIEPSGVGRFARWSLPEGPPQARDPVGERCRSVFEWRP